MVAHLGPAARRRNTCAADSPCASACSAPTQPPGRSSRAAVDSSTRMASARPRPTRARARGRGRGPRGRRSPRPRGGCTAGCTRPRRRCRPARGMRRPCRHAGGRPRSAGCEGPTRARPGPAPLRDLGAGHLVRTLRAIAPSRSRGRRRPGSSPASPARSIAQPARSSVSGRGTKTPGPTSSSTCRNAAEPVRYWRGSRAARRSTSSSKAVAWSSPTMSTSGSWLRVVPRTWASSSAASYSGLATPDSLSRAAAARRAAPRGSTCGELTGLGKSSRAAMSASTQDAITLSRSPSRTRSRS